MKSITIGNLVLEITDERKARIVDAIKETQRQIDREMTRYSDEHRNHEAIARWNNHIARLTAMIS
jgi:hypothetical protein